MGSGASGTGGNAIVNRYDGIAGELGIAGDDGI
jgi:hypothetical protein